MIFKENNTSTTELVLPPITTTKPESPAEVKPNEEEKHQEENDENKEVSSLKTNSIKNQEPNTKPQSISQNLVNHNLTMDSIKNENNRYKLQDNQTIQEENSKTEREEQNKKPEEKARTISTIKTLSNQDNAYIAKVILENIRSLNDCIYLLENYLKENKIQTYYETSTNQDKFIFLFAEEKIAFHFTKIIYNEKNKNYLYKNVKVTFSLEPNQTYFKKLKNKNKKRGLSYESIMQLYRGSSYVKKVKELPKIIGNVNLGIKSPFYVISLKRKKNKYNYNTSKSLKFSRNYKNNIEEFVGYDGNPLKSYEKQKISVLDTHYNPNSKFKFREEDKNKWFCPANFKLY